MSDIDSHFRDVCEDVTRAVGQTPIIALDRLTSKLSLSSRILAKCEFMNPTGSMKDRMAVQTIEDAERSSLLKRGDTVIVLTSGNGGIALAAVCAAKGYKLVVTMSEGNSPERRRIIRALGAELVLVPQIKGSIPGQVSHEDLEAVEIRTEELTRSLHAFRVDQFTNESNPKGHERTGEEIWVQTNGGVTSFVAFVGSSGNFTGVSRALKRHRKPIKCYAVEPKTAPFLSGEQVTNTSHKIQGGSYAQPLILFDKNTCDGFLYVSDEEAIFTSRDLARLEGLIVGFSSGANVAAAVKLATQSTSYEKIVTILPDTGLRYLSTDLFE
jgi:cysteine synthase A